MALTSAATIADQAPLTVYLRVRQGDSLAQQITAVAVDWTGTYTVSLVRAGTTDTTSVTVAAALIGSDTVYTFTASDTATAALDLGRHRVYVTETGDDHTYLAGWLEISAL